MLWLAPVAILGLVMEVSSLDLAQRLENVTVDWRFKGREASDPPADPRILLVGIGEHSLRSVGRWEEWTREIHALFLNRLLARPPRVVAYDFLFTEPSKDPAKDEVFAEMMAYFPGGVTAAFADDTRADDDLYAGESIGKTRPLTRVSGDRSALVSAPGGPTPIPVLAESSWTGFVNSPPSRIDGIRRKIPLVVGFAGQVYPSFVLQILMQMEEVGPDAVEVVLGDSIRLEGRDGGVREIPIERDGFMHLNYRGRAAFEPVDYIELMQKLDEFGGAETWPETLPPIEGQVLLVGQMAEGLTDFGPTPFSAREPLVLVQAVALDNILRGDYLRIVPLWQVMLGWLPLAWGTLWFLRKSPVVLAAAVPLVLVAAFVAAASLIFQARSIQLPLFLPVAGFVLVHGGALVDRLVVETRAKRRIKGLFGTYAPPEVVDAMIASGEDPQLGGQEMEITAFFSDVEGFSTFSEQLDPEQLVRLMNDYLSSMTEVLFGRGGTLDKYIGDAIVAMFGAPSPFADHAYRACAASIEIQRRQGALCARWRGEGTWPGNVHSMRTRIGLNTGPAVIGNMGSPRRFNYTMMGDTVNLAARCESGAKSYGVLTMVTGETRAAASSARDDILFRYLDKIVVKGRTQPAEVHEVLGFRDELPGGTKDCVEIYLGGIGRYLAREWDAARNAFLRSAALEPSPLGAVPTASDSNPSLVMAERCLRMRENPPGDDWDGRYVMTSK